MHTRLFLPRSITDPLSFLLNHLPQHKHRNSQDVSAWLYCWPVMCTILQEMDYLMHNKLPSPLLDPCRK
ncbi:uncharacterized protein BX663DRAFT_520269 [Cokeromyces recurvatus]|uniref:uncharacterized protein n=1 Tax=Cokeromyces recurvatus TaxID=90255 RepID=UPI00221F699E|nr:uncharacterized protein BX663DRAFT_520269 [Cokeromyces recurvatus]KAI7899740.1 hypothetical protein BX663DRAFT_520269 [Cokeromyces recurvatus]